MKNLTAIALSVSISVFTAMAAEKGLKLESLPAAVRKTVKAETQNATIVGIAKEKENGVTQYEVETKVNGKVRDFNVDEKGVLLVVEEEAALESFPAAAREALMKKIGTGKVTLAETVKKGAETYYEVGFTNKAGKKSEVAVNADGSGHK